MYTTYTDTPDTPGQSNIDNALYTSIPSYTTSDHVSSHLYLQSELSHHSTQKPVVSVLLLPQSLPNAGPTPPMLKLPISYRPQPDPYATLKRYIGRSFDRLIGYCWWLLTVLGAGSAIFGAGNFVLGLGFWSWWRRQPPGSPRAGN